MIFVGFRNVLLVYFDSFGFRSVTIRSYTVYTYVDNWSTISSVISARLTESLSVNIDLAIIADGMLSRKTKFKKPEKVTGGRPGDRVKGRTMNGFLPRASY